MTIKGGDDRGGNPAVILLEMHETARKGENLPRFNCLRNQNVGGRDEADFEFAVEHEDELRRTRVHVRGVESAGSVVDAADGDAEGVESRDAQHVGGSDEGALSVVGVSRLGQDLGGEVARVELGLAGEPVDFNGWKRKANIRGYDFGARVRQIRHLEFRVS